MQDSGFLCRIRFVCKALLSLVPLLPGKQLPGEIRFHRKPGRSENELLEAEVRMSVNRLKWIAPLLVGLISVLAKGSPQSLQVEGDRLVLPKASYSKWQGTVIPGVPETMREWITTYLEELPNFVCDYKEIRSEMFRGNWVRMDSNEGQVRHVDGKSDFLVETESGILTNKLIWEVTSGSPDSFSSISGFLSTLQNYRFTPKGGGSFAFQSDAGVHLFSGYTKDGHPKDAKSYPTWGTVRVDKSSHAIREVIEYLRVPERGMLAGLFTSGFRAGEHFWVREFGYVDVGEKSYWLPKREEITSIYSDRKHDPQRVVQTYENCRRFEVDSTIRYVNSVDASQPGFKQATGGTGSELGTTTEALEKGENTGLEVGAPAGSAGFAGRSPNIPPQAPPLLHNRLYPRLCEPLQNETPPPKIGPQGVPEMRRSPF